MRCASLRREVVFSLASKRPSHPAALFTSARMTDAPGPIFDAVRSYNYISRNDLRRCGPSGPAFAMRKDESRRRVHTTAGRGRT